MKAHPELAEKFPMEAGKIELDLPEDEEHFGIVHGNFDLFNFHLVNKGGNFECQSFNFDQAKHSWFLYDLGSVIFDVCFRLQENAAGTLDEAHVLESSQKFVDWLCDAYTNGKFKIDREQLRKACCMRRDAFKQMIEEDMKAGQNPGDLVKFLKACDNGAYQFFDVCIKPVEDLQEELFEPIKPVQKIEKPQAPALKFEVVGMVHGKKLDG